MPAWALQLRPDDWESLAMLWHVMGVEATRQADCVWLRGGEPDDVTRRLLPKIASAGYFEILPDGALLKPGHRVPLGHLPPGPWKPLHQFLSIGLPPTSVPSRTHPPVEMDLVPSEKVTEPNVLLTDLTSWYQYCRQVPQIRLRNCQFAVSDSGRTLIHGTPLPPVSGTRAVARAGLVTPCGWTFSPDIDAKILAQAWRIASGDLWLLWPGKAIERVLADQLVAANRSAVQATWEAFSYGRSS